jgi:hypothetical protein
VLYQAGLVDPDGMRLTIEMREQVSKKLAEKGVSERKIAAVTGVTQTQVRRDLGRAKPKVSKSETKGFSDTPKMPTEAEAEEGYPAVVVAADRLAVDDARARPQAGESVDN